jgi:hypothetical protein
MANIQILIYIPHSGVKALLKSVMKKATVHRANATSDLWKDYKFLQY